MGRKGLSRDEKLERLETLLRDSVCVVPLKELEKRCYKEKGIVKQSVKEIAQELVDDNMICLDKIGTSNYYWAFPSQALKVRRQKLSDFGVENQQTKRKREELEEQVETLTQERSDDARAEKLARLEELTKEEAELDAEIETLRANDPAVLDALTKAEKAGAQAVERWTDNIMELIKYAVKNFHLQDAPKQLELEYEYLD